MLRSTSIARGGCDEHSGINRGMIAGTYEIKTGYKLVMRTHAVHQDTDLYEDISQVERHDDLT